MYPKELFHANETVTRENIRAYDARKDKVYDTYYTTYTAEERVKIGFRERMDLLRKIEVDLYGDNYVF